MSAPVAVEIQINDVKPVPPGAGREGAQNASFDLCLSFRIDRKQQAHALTVPRLIAYRKPDNTIGWGPQDRVKANGAMTKWINSAINENLWVQQYAKSVPSKN